MPTSSNNQLEQPASFRDYHLSDYYQHATNALAGHEPSSEPLDGTVVWHTTQKERMGSISRHGLVPYGNLYPPEEGNPEPWIDAMGWLDDQRPAHIPVSLRTSIFAQPLGPHILEIPQGHPVYVSEGVASPDPAFTNSNNDMLAIAVDPETAYVTPGLVGEAARKLEISRSDKAAAMGKKYWQQAMPLKRFLDLYEKHEGSEILKSPYNKQLMARPVVWRLRDPSQADAEHGVPLVYDPAPEVIVPVEASGSIPPERIRHVASSVINLYSRKVLGY